MTKHKVGFIGAGGRSVCYASAYVQNDEIDIVAVADPSAEHRKLMAKKTGLSGHAEYDTGADLLKEHDDLDGMVISTPNYLHQDDAVPCLERGMAVALEKPLAINKEDCERILAAERSNKGRLLIGFVLRSTPFYGKIHEIISSGAIGRVVSIQADELVGVGVSSLMNRSPWRRHVRMSGGAMLEKSCHDLDILNWMMGGRPLSLNSYGGMMIFEPDSGLPDSCEDCDREESCLYYKKPVFSDHEDEGEEILHQFIRDDARCIYNIDKDVADVQSIGLQYEGGAIANFMLNFNAMGKRSGRNVHAIGTDGRVWGNISENRVFWYRNSKGDAEEYDTSGDGSGHGGGDRVHALTLLQMMKDPDFVPAQGTYAGYLSAMECFAADMSMEQGKRIAFQYDQDGIINLA